jgi:hypothetical protein
MAYRFWVVITVLWEAWLAILYVGTYHHHNPKDGQDLAICAAIPLGFLAFGRAIKWVFAAGNKHT